jgi:G protein-coupled receptor 158
MTTPLFIFLFFYHQQSEISFYDDPNAFECLPCAEGCDSCEDASPCVAELNWPMRTSILILACAIIGFLPPAALFTFRYQQVKVEQLSLIIFRI